MPKLPKENRIFLVCKSKNCDEAKRSGVRCTISRMYKETDIISGGLTQSLNQRKFCVLYSEPAIIKISNTPNWCVSTDKPGKRKQLQKAQEAEQKFYAENPDFLEL